MPSALLPPGCRGPLPGDAVPSFATVELATVELLLRSLSLVGSDIRAGALDLAD